MAKPNTVAKVLNAADEASDFGAVATDVVCCHAHDPNPLTLLTI